MRKTINWKDQMKSLGILFLSVFLMGSQKFLSAQELRIGQWRDHLPYNKCISLALGGGRTYVATQYSLFYYDKNDNSIVRKNKVNGLSDAGISSIAYSEKYSTLVVAYSNTNIDLIKGETVINIPDIKRKQILGNKSINKIFINGKYAYLSCGFGIVVLDIDRQEIHDTYYIGPSGSQINVLALTLNPVDKKFYAATEKGIYSVDSASNLAFFENWTKQDSIDAPNDRFNLVTAFGGKVYANSTKTSWNSDNLYVYNGIRWDRFDTANHSNRSSINVSNNHLLICNYLMVNVLNQNGVRVGNYYSYEPGNIRPNDALFDETGDLWIADNDKGLWRIDGSSVGHQYIINGPSSTRVAAMDISGTELWAVPGGRNASFGGLSNAAQFYTYSDENWTSYTETSFPFLHDMRDLLCVATDPLNGKHAFIGSWGNGIIEFKDGQLVNTYTSSNSSLQTSIYAENLIFIGGMGYDSDNNLWISNSTAPNVLSVRKSSGEWKSYNMGSIGTGIYTGAIVVDQSNQKWMQMRDLSLLVFNDNNTLDNTADDRVYKLTNGVGNGNLPGNGIASFAVDKDGQLWLGSDQGVAVIYSPQNVSTGANFDAQKVMVTLDGYLHPLLETEAVTAIAVNGNNEKWMGTDKSGVFLMSADGSTEIFHFTEENSPLLSNSITSIKIASDGEVFFGTANGIVSYRDEASPPSDVLDSAYVYPNPVREDYIGNITIKNLVGDWVIKITDISGNLVRELSKATSPDRDLTGSGSVDWDGKDFDGNKVKTGVYLIMISNDAGTMKKVLKILIFNRE
jgi:ligand-binding sensor domain-containing protein